jgi:hypothetical protein
VAQVLSYPFRLGPGGKIATVEQGTPQANGELIEVLLLTRLGERPLAPAFGISDPLFSAIEPTEIAAGISAFGPDVTLNDITTTQADPQTARIQIDYT